MDNIYVESISRLGRNVDDLREVVQEFKDNETTVHFIKEGFNIGNENNMFKFMLTILGTVAEMERELTVERIRKRFEKTRKNGTKSGRPNGDITTTDFARLIEVSRPRLYKYIEAHGELSI